MNEDKDEQKNKRHGVGAAKHAEHSAKHMHNMHTTCHSARPERRRQGTHTHTRDEKKKKKNVRRNNKTFIFEIQINI